MAKWLVVVEAKIDHDVATGIADRIICRELPWADGIVEEVRSYVDVNDDLGFSKWTDIKKLYSKFGPRYGAVGRFGSGHGGGAAREIAKVQKLVHQMKLEILGLLLIRDSDRHGDRSEAFRNAQPISGATWKVCGACAHKEIEAWVLNGFEAADDNEEDELAAVRSDLKRCPVKDAHLLSEPKDSLGRLTSASRDRQEDCWLKTPLADLRKRGQHTGLAEYLDAVAMNIVPTIGPDPAPR